MSKLTDIAKAVRDEINAATLSLSASTVFAFVPEYDGTEDGLKVFVLGLSEGIAPQSREWSSHSYGVTVAIYKRIVTDADVEAVDDYRQEVIELLKSKSRLTAYDDAALVSIANDPVYAASELSTKKTYMSIIQLVYQEMS